MSWSVSVERDGENVVTIASNCLSGRDLSPEDEEAIRTAAQHLLSFVGAKKSPCAEGWHRSESRGPNQRCVECGYEWIFPEAKSSDGQK
jgi:hypothetical protein